MWGATPWAPGPNPTMGGQAIAGTIGAAANIPPYTDILFIMKQ
jgi:hypothetical protein